MLCHITRVPSCMETMEVKQRERKKSHEEQPEMRNEWLHYPFLCGWRLCVRTFLYRIYCVFSARFKRKLLLIP